MDANKYLKSDELKKLILANLKKFTRIVMYQ